MNGAALVLATLSLGVDYGWQPTEQGDLEYIIQIEPELIQSLLEGREISSEVFPDLKDVRRFRIRVGDQEVPRETPSPVDPPTVEETVEAVEDQPAADASDVSGDSGDSAITEEAPVQENPPAGTAAPSPTGAQPPPPSSLQWPGAAENQFSKRPVDPDESPVVSEMPPDPLEPDPQSRPLENRQAGFVQETADKESVVRSPSDEILAGNESAKGSATAPGGAKPWWPLTAAVVALFTSLGGNAYLAWLALGFRARCLSLAARS